MWDSADGGEQQGPWSEWPGSAPTGLGQPMVVLVKLGKIRRSVFCCSGEEKVEILCWCAWRQEEDKRLCNTNDE